MGQVTTFGQRANPEAARKPRMAGRENTGDAELTGDLGRQRKSSEVMCCVRGRALAVCRRNYGLISPNQEQSGST